LFILLSIIHEEYIVFFAHVKVFVGVDTPAGQDRQPSQRTPARISANIPLFADGRFLCNQGIFRGVVLKSI